MPGARMCSSRPKAMAPEGWRIGVIDIDLTLGHCRCRARPGSRRASVCTCIWALRLLPRGLAFSPLIVKIRGKLLQLPDQSIEMIDVGAKIPCRCCLLLTPQKPLRLQITNVLLQGRLGHIQTLQQLPLRREGGLCRVHPVTQQLNQNIELGRVQPKTLLAPNEDVRNSGKSVAHHGRAEDPFSRGLLAFCRGGCCLLWRGLFLGHGSRLLSALDLRATLPWNKALQRVGGVQFLCPPVFRYPGGCCFPLTE
ncbi:hypothetical protein SAMN05421763_1112 [[Luteovulum] sphaeroides subsp. megalophilum]|nr:hypothetical protein SAMN05421763_1112 [[Luteovulum] sphaeroides subsp. megalophilum]